MMVSRVICKAHNFKATVGSAVQFALDYYECPQCVALEDAEYAAASQPCCSRMNIDCCGHDEDDDSQVSVEVAMPGIGIYQALIIESSNYCTAPPF